MQYRLNENIDPDNAVFNGETHKATDGDSYAFAIFDNGQIMWAHRSGISREEFLLSTVSGKLYGDYNKYKEIDGNFPDDFINAYKQLKSEIKYEGRWYNGEGLITYYGNLSLQEVKTIVDYVYSSLAIPKNERLYVEWNNNFITTKELFNIDANSDTNADIKSIPIEQVQFRYISPDSVMYMDNGRIESVLWDDGQSNCKPFIVFKDGYVMIGKEGEAHTPMARSYTGKEWGEATNHIECRGRIFYTFNKPLITFWERFDDFGTKVSVSMKVAKSAGINPKDAYITVSTNKVESLATQDIEDFHDEDLSDAEAIHLADYDEKRDKMGAYLRDRSANQGKKLAYSNGNGEMTRAEWNNLHRIGDSIVYTKKQIKEEIDRITSVRSRQKPLNESDNKSIGRVLKVTPDAFKTLIESIVKETFKK